MRRKLKRGMVTIGFAVAASSFCVWPHGTATPRATDNAAVSAAVCPVVYPLDESSSERGYHYIFYGNAFFIDGDGYLVTAALPPVATECAAVLHRENRSVHAPP